MEGDLSSIRTQEKDSRSSLSDWVILGVIILAFVYFIFIYSPTSLPPNSNSNVQPPIQPSIISPANETFGLGGNARGSMLTNHEFIEGLYSDLNLSDSNAMFRFVFNSLPEKVVVYPTENYFYFRFTGSGHTVKGSFSLFAKDRDDGNFGFGYIAFDEFPALEYNTGRVGGGNQYNANDGVLVKKVSDFEYDITLENKTVKFILNDVGVAPPKKAILSPEEQYIGTSFDESGLKFFLVYNTAMNNVYWVLNEDEFVPEQFQAYLPELSLVRGDRTDFVFYDDQNHSRKILIGAKGENVLANNWYDGPFDQMPDNYVKTGKINYDAVVRAYYASGRVDEYLGYIDNPGTRIAVAPYTVYFDENYFDFVRKCGAENAASSPRFLACIAVQQYNVPSSVKWGSS